VALGTIFGSRVLHEGQGHPSFFIIGPQISSLACGCALFEAPDACGPVSLLPKGQRSSSELASAWHAAGALGTV